MAVYENPLNEKIRLFSRLEFLIHRFNFYMQHPKPENCHSALMILLDLNDLSSRLDVKSATLSLQETQIPTLSKMTGLDEADRIRLEARLASLDSKAEKLHEFRGQLGQHLRGHSFLNMLKQRSLIAGGINSFDVPVFNFWLSRPQTVRVADLEEWVAPFRVAYNAISIVLDLVRQSGTKVSQVAKDGFYQASLGSDKEYQLLRIELPDEAHFFPEVSAGKQRFSLRFVNADHLKERGKQVPQDVEFILTVC